VPALIQGCDMAVAEVHDSPALKAYIGRERVGPEDAAALHHYRIYLGKGGCHEAFARSVYGSGTGKMSRAFAAVANRLRRAG
jgi:hypothetical protein